jgi:hypothetical protein
MERHEESKMSDKKICCVVPSIRPERMEKFKKTWSPLFKKHEVTLITVWDGENPQFQVGDSDRKHSAFSIDGINDEIRSLFYQFTDAVRNVGFFLAARNGFDYILTLDDDVEPVYDTIQDHLDVLNRRVPISWMNTATDGGHEGIWQPTKVPYLRGVPYNIRDEAPVMLSHGVWTCVPDFDGETQLKLEQSPSGIPGVLPYYRGPIPKGVLFPLCGMNVMVKKEALPYFYFAPMGQDTGIEGECPVCRGKYYDVGGPPGCVCEKCTKGRVPALNRFADIWMGIFLKQELDKLGWACYSGGATVVHTRASDARKNMEQEKLGREWNEWLCRWLCLEEDNLGGYGSPEFWKYLDDYREKRERYAELIRSIQCTPKGTNPFC